MEFSSDLKFVSKEALSLGQQNGRQFPQTNGALRGVSGDGEYVRTQRFLSRLVVKQPLSDGTAGKDMREFRQSPDKLAYVLLQIKRRNQS